MFRKDYTTPNDDGTGPAIRSIDRFIEPGKTTGELPDKILDDKLEEPAETFTAVIQQVDGANLKVPLTRTVTLTDYPATAPIFEHPPAVFRGEF